MLKFATCFLVLCGLGQAQDSFTHDSPNGRFWVGAMGQHDGQSQLMYVLGYRDAIDAANRSPDVTQPFVRGTGFSNQEVVDAIGVFYQDPANLLIPISSATQICS